MDWAGWDGTTERRKPRLGVWQMALALATAAFLGGALGLVWQSAGLGSDEGEEQAAAAEDGAEAP